MTREEAIKVLKNPPRVYDEDMWTALDMAIEALSAEAEDRLYIKIYADDEPSVKVEKLYQICGEIQSREVAKWLKEYFPSADAVQGKWIITKEGEYDGRSVYKTVCSECGHETFYKANKAHFCPNCGARMYKGGEEE